MRGSPLLRFSLMALALLAAALGLNRVTAARTTSAPSPPPVSVSPPEPQSERVPFRLVLSAPASAGTIRAGQTVTLAAGTNVQEGWLEIQPSQPVIEVRIQWNLPTPSGEHRFAKLILEPSGRDTITHVFDAQGDIDDVLELPIVLQP